MKPTYEWKWQRNKGKHFLVLLKDGKKIGTAKQLWGWNMMQICSCWPDYNCYGLNYDELEEKGPNFIAYVGGKQLAGRFDSMTDAKIAVEQALGVSTKKEKRMEPILIRPVRQTSHVIF